MPKVKSRFLEIATDDEVEEAFRLRMLYGFTPSKIARKMKVSKDKVRDLLIAATYWGKGYSDGRR